jgi:hypothetical protein
MRASQGKLDKLTMVLVTTHLATTKGKTQVRRKKVTKVTGKPMSWIVSLAFFRALEK